MRRYCRPSLDASRALTSASAGSKTAPPGCSGRGFLRLTNFDGRDGARQSAAVPPCSAVIGVWARARPDAGLLTADPLDTGWSAADSPGPSSRPEGGIEAGVGRGAISPICTQIYPGPRSRCRASGTAPIKTPRLLSADPGPYPSRSLVNGLMTETGFASAAHGRNGFGSLFSPAGCAGIPRGSKKRPAAVFR